MQILTKARKNARQQVSAEELAKVKPLPVWFFAFEGCWGPLTTCVTRGPVPGR